MLFSTLLLYLIVFLCPSLLSAIEVPGDAQVEGDNDSGAKLISEIKKADANLDLSVDEEYEDLRAELLAYHTALNSLVYGRRSQVTTPCWELGGICINHKLCTGFKYLTQVPGCKDKQNVCCFTWNRYKVRDLTEYGISAPFPWSQHKKFGGAGIVQKEPRGGLKKKKGNKNKQRRRNSTAYPLFGIDYLVGVDDADDKMVKVSGVDGRSRNRKKGIWRTF